jgi:hypothetical protein
MMRVHRQIHVEESVGGGEKYQVWTMQGRNRNKKTKSK